MKFVTDKSKGILGSPDSVELWTQIIDQIPEDLLLKPGLRILNIACGHCTEAVILANRMLALGVNPSEVQKSFTLLDKYQVFTNPAKMLYGFENVITADFLTWRAANLMERFDIILSNPPYTDGKKSANVIWDEFIIQGMSSLKENGIIAMIVTQSLAISKDYEKVRKELSKRGIQSIRFFDSTVFDIGNTTMYFIAGGNKTPTTKIIQEDNQYRMEYIDDIFYKDRILSSIVKKIESRQGKNYYKNTSYLFRAESCLKKQCKMVHLLNGLMIDIDQGDDYGSYTMNHKVVSSYLANDPIAIKASWYVPPGVSTGKKYRSMIVNSEVEGKILESLFKSKLFLFVFKKTVSSRTLDGAQMRFLPKLDLTRQWSNTEIYEHFNLTLEEIEYVESNVK